MGSKTRVSHQTAGREARGAAEEGADAFCDIMPEHPHATPLNQKRGKKGPLAPLFCGAHHDSNSRREC
jgi:hypothetical protein